MKRLCGLLMTLMLLVMTATAVGAAPTDSAELEAFLDQVVRRQMEENGVAGVTVSVVAGGSVVLSKGYGYADLDAQVAVDGDRTLFRVGSVSKLFVATSVMQLVEQGKLDLHADVNTYLDFQLPDTLLSGQADQPITLVHLLTHAAGFEDVGEGTLYLSEEMVMPLDVYARTLTPARVFPAGEVMAYSNYGWALAGYIVERVSGLPFAQYVEENIFAPLDMQNSTFRQPVDERLAADVAIGYRWIDGERVDGEFVYALGPAGALSTTAGDIAKFMLAHLQGGRGILGEATAGQMQHRLVGAHPALDGMAYGFLEQTVNGHRMIWHPGSVLLFTSGLYLFPDADLGLFVSYSGGHHLLAAELFQAFMDRYYPATAASAPVLTEGHGARARAYVGEYSINRRSFTTDSSLLSLMESVQVATDAEGYLLVTHMGETDRFVEVGPGLYRNLRTEPSVDPYGAFRSISFQQTSDGKLVLAADGPMSYTRAPWYATSGFTMLTVLLCFLLLVSAPLIWLVGFVVDRIRRRERQAAKLSVGARGVAAGFGVITLVFLVGTLILSGDMEPAFGVPKVYFGIEPAWSSLLGILPRLLAIVGGAMLALTVVVWRQAFWRLWGRLHYTLVTAAACVLVAVLTYWNVLW